MSMMVSVITSWLRRWVFVRYENHLHYRERERERERESHRFGFWGNTDKRWAFVWFGDQIDIYSVFFIFLCSALSCHLGSWVFFGHTRLCFCSQNGSLEYRPFMLRIRNFGKNYRVFWWTTLFVNYFTKKFLLV